MKKILITVFCCLFGIAAAMADVVKGVVYEPSGETAIGATVIEKGNPAAGTSTNVDGEFTLNVSSLNATIVVSYIGMETQEIKLGGRSQVEVHLKDAGGVNLDEVVVVGYGVQKKINATGAVKTIDNAVLESRPISNAVQGLQGAVAGLNITNDSGGGLGQSMSINIRGVGTIGTGSTSSPLILIDGMEGDLSTVNPNDIENISVLKDAASASIYGSRAPFGVILVTTKSGERGTQVNYSGNVRFQQPIKVPHMASGLEFALMMNDAYLNAGGNAPFGSGHLQLIRDYMAGLNGGVGPKSWSPNEWGENQSCYGSTDWYDVHVKDIVFSQEHNFSVSGAGDKVTYYFSGNYLDQNGLFRYADENYRRLTLTAKANIKFNKYVSFNWTTRLVSTRNKKPSALDGLFFHNLGRRAAVVPVMMPDDTPAAGEYHKDSLIPALQDGGDQIQNTQTVYTQGTLLVTPLEDWNIHVELNSRVSNNPYTRQFKPIYQTLPDGTVSPYLVMEGMTASHSASSGGFSVVPGVGENYYEKQTRNINYFSTNIYTDYKKTFGKNEFKFLVGMQTEYYRNEANRMASWSVQIPDIPYIPSLVGDENSMQSESKGEWSNIGIFGRINYNYDNRYMAEFNLRTDGASRFPKDQRWGWFPSFSLGWNIAEEHFWEPLGEAGFNYLKLRGSYGTQGNQNTSSYYPYYQSMNTSGASLVLGGAQATVLPMYSPYSTSLTWERIENLNLGVDFGLFRNRLTGLFEWYQRTTKDMVGPAQSLAGVFGASAPRTNNAELRTRGWEVEVAWRDRIGDLSYGISGTLSDYKTVVTKYDSPNNSLGDWYAGRDYGEIWGFRFLGISKSDDEMNEYLSRVDQSALGNNWGGGDVMYRDLNGDGSVNRGAGKFDDSGDFTIIGNNTPRFAYSFTLDAQWKFLDIRAYFQGIGKRDYLFSGSAPFYGVASEWQRTLYVDHLDYFRYAGSELGANLDPYYGRLRIDQNNIQDCDHFMQDASYIRLKNLQIGVSLPRNTKLAKYVKKARLYLSGENLFTHTNLRIFDPEAVSGDWGPGKAYPQYRTYSIGLELSF